MCLRVFGERQVALVFLGEVELQDGMEPVEQAAQLDDVVVVGAAGFDVVDDLADPADQVRISTSTRLIVAVGGAAEHAGEAGYSCRLRLARAGRAPPPGAGDLPDAGIASAGAGREVVGDGAHCAMSGERPGVRG